MPRIIVGLLCRWLTRDPQFPGHPSAFFFPHSVHLHLLPGDDSSPRGPGGLWWRSQLPVHLHTCAPSSCRWASSTQSLSQVMRWGSALGKCHVSPGLECRVGVWLREAGRFSPGMELCREERVHGGTRSSVDRPVVTSRVYVSAAAPSPNTARVTWDNDSLGKSPGRPARSWEETGAHRPCPPGA